MADKKDVAFDFEAAYKRLDEIVKEMDEGDLGLNELLKRFEEGMGLAQQCEKRLTEVEGRVRELVEGEDGELEERPFDKA